LEAEKLTLEMIAESATWLEAGRGAETVRQWWVAQVRKAHDEEEADEFDQRWALAFENAKAKPEAVAKPLTYRELKAAMAVGEAERAEAAAKATAAQPTEAPREEEQKAEPEPEAEPEGEPKRKPITVSFSLDDPIEDTEPAVLSPTASYDNAREFARRRCWRAGSLAVYAWGGKFWEWNGRTYRAMPR
jgi:hypothetical protein